MATIPEDQRYFTPKLGIAVPSVDDEMSAMRPAWDRLDQAYAGAIVVNPGVQPDESVLFDGCLVAERSTGIIWRAQRNPAGIFEKRYVKYPLRIQAAETGSWPSTGTNFTAMGYSNLEGTFVNVGSEVLQNNRIIIPITGIYQGCDRIKWQGPGTTGNRNHSLWVNDQSGGAVDFTRYEMSGQANNIFNQDVVNNVTFTRKFNKGDTVCAGVWQNSGVNLNYLHYIQMALVRAVD